MWYFVGVYFVGNVVVLFGNGLVFGVGSDDVFLLVVKYFYVIVLVCIVFFLSGMCVVGVLVLLGVDGISISVFVLVVVMWVVNVIVI